MALQTLSLGVADAQYPGNEYEQKNPIIGDVYDSMADDDTVVFPAFGADGDTGLPPRRVQVLRHTGGDITSAAAATRAMSNGDVADFYIDHDRNGVYEKVTHTFGGLSAAAATPAQIATSINGNVLLSPFIKAVASLTANAVTLFPVKARSRVYVGAQPAVLGFGGTADYNARTYVSQTMHVLGGTTGFSWSYNATTRVLTLQNETSGAVNRVHIIVHR